MSVTIDLAGQVILVCGVSRGGIGGATARRLAAAGALVVAVDRTAQLVDETVADIVNAGGKCHGIVTNLLDPDDSGHLIADIVARFGALDGVANVAGGDGEDYVPLERTTLELYRHMLNLNLEYVFRISRDAAASMIERGVPGAIVNVGSISALTSAPHHGPYGAAKAGIAALTRTMAFEWAQYGIRANTASPGAVYTRRNADRMDPAREPDPAMVWTSVDEMADAILFLLSDLASGVSGQDLVIDSGLSTKFCGGSRPFPSPKNTPPR